nr:hypothetical protein [Tanacetum cinerariifolium]
MEAGSKDRPPMLAPVQIILTGIANDIYSTVDACSNACEMWKAIERIGNVAGARETVGSMTVQKSGIQCYYCKEFGHVARECQKPKRAKDAAYHREKMLLCKQEEARIQLNAEQADWRDNTDDDELEDQELEAHYIEHPEQSESVHYTYLIDQDVHNVIIDSLDMSYDRDEIDQNDDDNNLANERELLASLIEKLKCEIDENKNRNKFLETSNKVLIKQLKGEIENFKTKYKSLESSNNHFKKANNKLSETNNLLYADYKKSEAELARRNSKEIGNVAGARETVGSMTVQKSGIQCYYCKEFGHVARECQKPKRAKDAAYHREKMLLCKQEEARIQLNAEQADWRDNTDDDELEDQELEAHYMYMAQL